MKRKLAWFTIVALLATLVACVPASASAAAATSATAQPAGKAFMPACEEKVMAALRDRNVIPASASEDEAEAILADYLSGKMGNRPNDYPNPLAAERIRDAEERSGGGAAGYHGKKLGRQIPVDPIDPTPWPDDPAFDKILMVLVEFTDPEHNQLPQPGPDNNVDIWVPDFDQQHYQDTLFDLTPGAKSMANYYLEQSCGQYTVYGSAYGWYKVNFPESWYGADGETSNDNLNGPVWRVVVDALAEAGASVPWADYDQEDAYDLDGDGDYYEPDGYVDHIMIVHAGAGQEGGGGVQGDDAIWSHSSWVDYSVGVGPGYGGVQTGDPDVWVGPYTIMPEDGGIGVFCHEFGHDLGLPDEYDTIYSGESSVGFWSLMASGSWLGQPLGTEPSDISVWGRYALGWVNSVRFGLSSLPVEVQLDQVERPGPNAKAVRVDLPKKQTVLYVNEPYSGVNEWWSGRGDQIIHTLTRPIDLTGVSSAQAEIECWYNIELDWDYGYVEVSTDGVNFTPLPSTITTNTDPNGNNRGNGITGDSGGWVKATFDLASVVGGQAYLRISYYTDQAVNLNGLCVDDIAIPAIGLFDDVESGNAGWDSDGWSIFAGSSTNLVNHYYMLELRNYVGFDKALQYAYNFIGAETVQWVTYNKGVLLWYRDMEYGDNWVGVHPGHGFLLVVDSHSAPLNIYGFKLRTRMQTMDAAFGLDRTPENTITYAGKTRVFGGLPAVPEFNDSQSYWSPAKPDASVNVPTYGLHFRVTGAAPDGSSAVLGFYK